MKQKEKPKQAMGRREIEQHLESALSVLTPDIWSKLDLSVPQQPLQQDQPQQKIKRLAAFLPARKVKDFAAAAAVAFVVLGSAYYYEHIQIVSVVGVDVNPSIELHLNRREYVRAVRTYNQDGEELVDKSALKGKRLNQAVEQVVDSLVSQGYLNEEEKEQAILLSVSSKNAQKTESIKQELAVKVQQDLEKSNVQAVIYEQSVEITKEKKQLAGTYQVSVGKAEFIENLVTANEQLLAEDEVYSQLMAKPLGEITQEIAAQDYSVSSDVVIIYTEPVDKHSRRRQAEADGNGAGDDGQTGSAPPIKEQMQQALGEPAADETKEHLSTALPKVPETLPPMTLPGQLPELNAPAPAEDGENAVVTEPAAESKPELVSLPETSPGESPAEKPPAEKAPAAITEPAAVESTAVESAAEKAITEQSAAVDPTAEQAAAKQSTAAEPVADKPETDSSAGEKPRESSAGQLLEMESKNGNESDNESEQESSAVLTESSSETSAAEKSADENFTDENSIDENSADDSSPAEESSPARPLEREAAGEGESERESGAEPAGAESATAESVREQVMQQPDPSAPATKPAADRETEAQQPVTGPAESGLEAADTDEAVEISGNGYKIIHVNRLKPKRPFEPEYGGTADWWRIAGFSEEDLWMGPAYVSADWLFEQDEEKLGPGYIPK